MSSKVCASPEVFSEAKISPFSITIYNINNNTQSTCSCRIKIINKYFILEGFPQVSVINNSHMKYMRDRRPSRNSKDPDIWKILSLLYDHAGEDQDKLKLKRSKVSISKVMELCKCSRWIVNRVFKACE